ncbi:MAG: DUF441 domain-containing protein [Firmicutes bacterium]|nr:DUF441 domain-containing protein [Bacillota bacterium]
MYGFIFILLIFLLGLTTRSSSLTMAAGLLLLVKLCNIKSLLPFLGDRGLEIGLFFLMLAVLVPLAQEKVAVREIIMTFSSLPGILAIVGGIIATRLNGMGLTLLDSQPQVIFGLVIGSIIGIVFFRGVPVGPLMAGGLTAFFLYLCKLFCR